MQKNSNKIVLGQPLSGALFAYFDKEINDGNHTKAAAYHSYYKTLYGKNFQKNMDLAITLSLVVDDIIIAPADNPYPETNKYSVDGRYYNPNFGLYFNWEESHEIMMKSMSAMQPTVLNDSKIIEILRGVPKQAHEQIIKETFVEINLARKYDSPLFTMGRRQAIAKRIQELERTPELVSDSGNSPKFVKSYLDIFGLLFDPLSLDDFYYLKAEKDLKIYAKSFYKIMMESNLSDSEKPNLIELLQSAMNSDKLNKKLVGGFSVSSDVMDYAGLIPILGNATNAIGIGSSLAAKGVELFNRKNSWFELAPQVQRVKSLKKLEDALKSMKEKKVMP